MKKILVLGSMLFMVLAGQYLVADNMASHAAAPATPTWGPCPAVLPAGCKMIVLEGDPSKDGEMFTLRVMVPNGYKVAPHYHPTDEHLVIISGKFHIGMGDTIDKTKEMTLNKGGYGVAQANQHHYAWAEGNTEFILYAKGPFQVTYVNPADDPSPKK